ncbi:hypothetical protein E2P81_ATG10533, partial [Venturia nashicola]
PTPPTPSPSSFTPLVCVVDFHHARGPEIEHWIGAPPSRDPAEDNDWGLIPYMALPDGAHSLTEEFSYFTLVHKGREEGAEESSVFGISCTQQLDASKLLFKSEDVTRSAVQKAVVAITDRPGEFGRLREKLSVVTGAWFAQRDFRDVEILERFQENLAHEAKQNDGEKDQSFGLSLRELVHTYKWQTLVLFKCLLLQPKMLFFGSHCEQVCQVQFSLLSLIPGLIRNLQDCAAPHLDRYARTVRAQDSVRTSDRASLLAYMGLPLQIFGKGSLFGPYTPLQQLDTLTDEGTKSYILGSTNSLLLSQKERYCDIIINLDENLIEVLSPSLRHATTLSTADRRWMDFLTQAVNDTWDESDPSRPKTHGYAGSEEFIRLQFEEYLFAFLSAEKYHQYLSKQSAGDPKALLADVEGDPSIEFATTFRDAWQQTENYKLWQRLTDLHLFDIVEPRHPCAGGLTIEDVQRRLATQVAELHLDERFNQTREVVNERLAAGRTQVTSAFNKVWADIEVMREAQRKRGEEARAAAAAAPAADEKAPPQSGAAQQAQANVQAASQRASAYLSSWGSWAAEKRKQGWRAKVETPTPAAAPVAERVSVGERPHVTTVTELERGAAEDAKTLPGGDAGATGDKEHTTGAKEQA